MYSRIAQLLPLLPLILWSWGAGAVESANRQVAEGQTAPSAPAAEQIDAPAPALVEARAAAYFDALKLNDWHTAYRMHLGALDGSLTPLAFMQQLTRGGAKILSYEITDVTIVREAGRAVLEARVTYDLPQLFKPYTAPLRTEWVLRDGQLYRDADTPRGLPAGSAEQLRKELQ